MWWWGVGLLGLGLALVTWGALSVGEILYPDRRVFTPPQPLPHFTAHPLRAADGSAFDVWLLEATPPRARLLLFHGYFANRYQVLGIAQGLRERGYEVLLFELRGHGSRPGPYTCGIKETEDAMSTLQWASRREGEGGGPLPLGVLGLSAGAAVACQLARRDPQVRAVVTDSVYPRFYPIVRASLKHRYHLPAMPWAWVTWWSLQVALCRRITPLDPAALAPALRQPLLVIQGGEDRVVSISDSEVFYQRWAGPKERWVEPAIAHVGMFAWNPQEYCNRVATFFDRTLSQGA